jgi:hypothetical protein
MVSAQAGFLDAYAVIASAVVFVITGALLRYFARRGTPLLVLITVRGGRGSRCADGSPSCMRRGPLMSRVAKVFVSWYLTFSASSFVLGLDLVDDTHGPLLIVWNVIYWCGRGGGGG